MGMRRRMIIAAAFLDVDDVNHDHFMTAILHDVDFDENLISAAAFHRDHLGLWSIGNNMRVHFKPRDC